MVTEYLMALPAQLTLKATSTQPAANFNLNIFKNHSRELRMCYETDTLEEVEIPWDPGTKREWILLCENIDDDTAFVEAVQYILHQLIQLAQHFENPFEFTTTKA
jgi:hypothetical protein